MESKFGGKHILNELLLKEAGHARFAEKGFGIQSLSSVMQKHLILLVDVTALSPAINYLHLISFTITAVKDRTARLFRRSRSKHHEYSTDLHSSW